MKKFIRGLTLGTLVGAATGLLAAPKRGKETQEDLKRNLDSLSARAGEVAEAVGAEVEKQLEAKKPKLKRAQRAVEEALDAAVDEAEKVRVEKKAELKAEVKAAGAEPKKKANREKS